MSDSNNKVGNPDWEKGKSGNPRGRQHPDAALVVEKVLGAALDDDDPRQKDAWKIVMSKIAPDLKAQEIRADVGSHIGVIALPPKKPLDALNETNKIDQIETPPTPLPNNKSPR